MMKFAQRIILSFALLLLLTGIVTPNALATGVYDIPTVTPGQSTWVIDQGEVLSRSSEGETSKNLESLAKNTGNEIRIVTIRRLDYGETIDSLTQELFDKWFPTDEIKANQGLLVLDTLTNTSAFLTGKKVKDIMSDDIAKSIAQETLLFPLQQGDKYNQAVVSAGDRLVTVLSGKEDPGPPKIVDNIQAERTYKTSEETKKEQGNSTIWVIGLLIAATVIPMATYFWYQSLSS